jgi:hypothetical protein
LSIHSSKSEKLLDIYTKNNIPSWKVYLVMGTHDPQSDRQSHVIVCFSGIHEEMKKKLSEDIVRLHGSVRWNSAFDPQITHLVALPNTRTMKTLIASVLGKWLVTTGWVTDSVKVGYFLPEQSYGTKFSPRPFLGKKIFHFDTISKEKQKVSTTMLQNAYQPRCR